MTVGQGRGRTRASGREDLELSDGLTTCGPLWGFEDAPGLPFSASSTSPDLSRCLAYGEASSPPKELGTEPVPPSCPGKSTSVLTFCFTWLKP